MFTKAKNEQQLLLRDSRNLQLLDPSESISDTDVLYSINLLDGCNFRDQTHGMRVRMRIRLHNVIAPLLSAVVSVLLFASVLLLLTSASSVAQAQQAAANTTLAVFSDQPMPQGLWEALVTAFREEAASSPEAQALFDKASLNAGELAIPEIELIRGDAIQPGLVVDNAITVYLHGECTTDPSPHPDLYRQSLGSIPLGWVRIDHGQIEPFIHVECKHIGQVLGLQGIGHNSDQRNRIMAVAIARVILHEWIHINTQNPRHAKHGIAKAQFSVADLVARSSAPSVRRGTR
jgi:hypothetical protein